MTSNVGAPRYIFRFLVGRVLRAIFLYSTRIGGIALQISFTFRKDGRYRQLQSRQCAPLSLIWCLSIFFSASSTAVQATVHSQKCNFQPSLMHDLSTPTSASDHIVHRWLARCIRYFFTLWLVRTSSEPRCCRISHWQGWHQWLLAFWAIFLVEVLPEWLNKKSLLQQEVCSFFFL